MTCLLAIQHGSTVMLAGDTRITTEMEYTDGTTKVYRLNDRVLVGISGDANCIDVYLRYSGKVKRYANALAAARAMQIVLRGETDMNGASYAFLFVSFGMAVELSEDGLLTFPLGGGHIARAGSGGLVAEVHWMAMSHWPVSLEDAENRLLEAVATAARYRADCGLEVRMVRSA